MNKDDICFSFQVSTISRYSKQLPGVLVSHSVHFSLHELNFRFNRKRDERRTVHFVAINTYSTSSHKTLNVK